MSTNAIVRIKEKIGNKVVITELYKHYDGYIEGTGYTLLSMFMKNKNEIVIPKSTENVVLQLINKRYEYTIRKWTGVEYIYTIDIDNNSLEMAQCHLGKYNYVKDYIYNINDVIKDFKNFCEM